MRFIVDLFRYLIVGFCGLALIGATLIVLAALDRGSPLAGPLSGPSIVIAAAGLVVIVLNLGAVAILVSIHDRHAEIAASADALDSSVARIAAALERSVTRETAR